jgi:hypothetical protein
MISSRGGKGSSYKQQRQSDGLASHRVKHAAHKHVMTLLKLCLLKASAAC